MADLVLLDARGREKTYSDVNKIRVPLADGGTQVFVPEADQPVAEVPEEYAEYVEYAKANCYKENYENIAIWNAGDYLAVSFLMDDFEVENFDPYTTELTASGWYTCGYTKSSGEWTSHDYRNTTSPGESYAKNIVFASCRIKYGEQILFPVGVTDTIKINSIDFDDDAGTVTIVLATGQTEVLTWVKDADGNITGVTDSQGHTTLLSGVSA